MGKEFIENNTVLFKYYKSLGDNTFIQLKEPDFFWTPDSESNSIAIIIQHMAGNMLSRWTDFLTTDGEKDWRDREQEFNLYLKSKEECLLKWEEGWNCLFNALKTINNENYNQTIFIRSKGHSIMEAVLRQLSHYAYHVGQITFLGRQRANNWESLSIAKGESQQFNKQSFSKGQRQEHFTDQFLNQTNKRDQ